MRPGASSDGAMISADQPTPIGGAHRMIPDGEQRGSMTCSIARARATEGRHFGLLRRRHPSRGGGSTQPWPRCRARRSSERAARRTRRGDRGVRGQDRNVFRLLETCRDRVPGRQTPSRSVDPAEASLDVVKRQAPHLVKGHTLVWPERETRTENAGWRLDR